MLTGMATVLILIPDMDFDPTEVAVSWKRLPSMKRWERHLCRVVAPHRTAYRWLVAIWT